MPLWRRDCRIANIRSEHAECRPRIWARQIRDRSHPLFTIEMAVNSLSGLPDTFIDRIAEFATEFEIEYTVLGGVEVGTNDIDTIRKRALSNVLALSDESRRCRGRD